MGPLMMRWPALLSLCFVLASAAGSGKGAKADAPSVISEDQANAPAANVKEGGSCTEECRANFAGLEGRLEQLEMSMPEKANATDVLSKEQVHDHFRAFDSALRQRMNASQSSPAETQPEEKFDARNFLSKEEIHERFKLFNDFQATKLEELRAQVAELGSELQKLEDALLQKSDAGSIMSREEVHDRFRLFHAALQANPGANAGDQERLDKIEAALQGIVELRAASDSEDVEQRLRQMELAVQEASRGSGGWRWLVLVVCLCFPVVLALTSMCFAVSAHSHSEARIKTLEDLLAQQEEPEELMTNGHSEMSSESPRFRTKAISGAVGAGIGGATGAAVGTTVGGAMGAVVGLIPAIFTFGLSVPIGAALGSGLGLTTGTVLGGSTGAVGGIRAAGWMHAQGQRSRLGTEDSLAAGSVAESRVAGKLLDR